MYAMAENPKYYEDRVSFLAALAPSILFVHSHEPALKQMATMDWLKDMVVDMGYLEYGGRNMNREKDFIAYIQKDYPMFCEIN